MARSLGRAVPLSPQLIFTPAATVTAVQSDSSTQAASQVILLHITNNARTISSLNILLVMWKSYIKRNIELKSFEWNISSILSSLLMRIVRCLGRCDLSLSILS